MLLVTVLSKIDLVTLVHWSVNKHLVKGVFDSSVAAHVFKQGFPQIKGIRNGSASP